MTGNSSSREKNMRQRKQLRNVRNQAQGAGQGASTPGIQSAFNERHAPYPRLHSQTHTLSQGKPHHSSISESHLAKAMASVAALSKNSPREIERVLAELPKEVQALVTKLTQEVDDLSHALDDANSQIASLSRIADEDTFLPVLNRRGFMRELKRYLAYLRRYKSHASLIYIDLNDFKNINDLYGHYAGDLALQHVAEILLDNTRSSDLIGRLGGDEFALLLHEADYAAAEGKAAQLGQATQKSALTLPCNTQITLSMSYGVCEIEADHELEDIIELADKRMYQHKQSSKK